MRSFALSYIKVLILFSMTLTGFSLFAQASPPPATPQPPPQTACSDIVQRVGVFQMQRYQSTHNCLFSALPMNNPPYYYQYRSYLWTDNGVFMVFNSYEDFDVKDGARVFTFFPRNQLPTLDVVNGMPVMKSSVQGIDLVLNDKKSIIQSFTGVTFTEDYNVNPTNNGGIEILAANTLYLDSGFTIGKDPTTDLSARSTFHDINGKTCTVKNDELFKSIGHGDVSFLYNDQELKSFLANRCPALSVNW